MKVIDFINKSICKYPSLYLFHDYVSSSITVLDHAFGTIGNGLEWANTKKEEQGGYLCEPKNRRYNGEMVRTIDKPYGKEKSIVDIAKMFNNKIMWIITDNNDDFVGTDEEYRLSYRRSCCNIVEDVALNNAKRRGLKKYDMKYYGWCPYPYYKEEYHKLWDPKARFIQEDWKMSALWWLSECIEFWNDNARIMCCYENKNDYCICVEKEKPRALAFYKETVKHLVGI